MKQKLDGDRLIDRSIFVVSAKIQFRAFTLQMVDCRPDSGLIAQPWSPMIQTTVTEGDSPARPRCEEEWLKGEGHGHINIGKKCYLLRGRDLYHLVLRLNSVTKFCFRDVRQGCCLNQSINKKIFTARSKPTSVEHHLPLLAGTKN